MSIRRLIILFIIPLLLLGCNRSKNNPGYDYMGTHDMYYTKFYKAFSPNPVFRDSVTNQPPAEGVVARNSFYFPYPGATLAERAVNQSKAGKELTNPVDMDADVLAKGKEHYRIFCSNCHGVQKHKDVQKK